MDGYVKGQIDLRKIDEEIDGLKDRQIDGEMERVMLK